MEKQETSTEEPSCLGSTEAPCYLLPCPFCGAKEPEIEWGDDDIVHRCQKCGTKGPSTWYEDGFLDIHGDVVEADAEVDNVAKWNKRSTADNDDSHKETWIAAVNSTDMIFKETVRKGMEDFSPEGFYEWIGAFVR